MNKSYYLICKIGYHISNIGYLYLADAVEFSKENIEIAYQSIDKVYQHVATLRSTTAFAVSRAIARAVEDIWDCSRNKLFRVIGCETSEKLSPGGPDSILRQFYYHKRGCGLIHILFFSIFFIV